MPQLGPLEIVVILVIALLVFGPKRLPEVGRQVGRGLRELRKVQETVRDELHDVMHAADSPPAVAAPSSAPPPSVSIDSTTPGRPAPSRFRPAPEATTTEPPVTPPRPEMGRSGATAPSRFRAPGA